MKYKVTSEHPSIKSGLYLTRLSLDSNYFICDGLTSNNIHVIHVEDWLRKGWIKPIQETLTPGKYYAISTDKWMVHITSKHSGYGFNYKGEWFTLDNPEYEWGFLESMYEISKEQFYNRLLEYAKEKYPNGTLVRWPLWEKGKIYKVIKPYIGLDDNVIFAEVKDGENSKTITLLEDGLWIDIVKKPIHKCTDGQFIYEDTFIKNEVYVLKYPNGASIVRAEELEIEDLKLRTISDIANYYDFKYMYSLVNGWYLVDLVSFQPANKNQIKYLEKCEKKGIFIPLNKKNKFSKKDMISFAKYAKSYSNPKDVDECFEKWNNRRNQVDLLSL